MEKRIINFKASGQSLQRVGGIVTAASDTVNYFEAHFELDENWESFVGVRAIWSNGIKDVPRVLNHGVCKIPSDVLADVSKLKVNLVGSVSENGVLTDRLTTFQCPAFGVTVKVPIDGTDPEEIPASQFEHFTEVVKEDADRAEQAVEDAREQAEQAEAWANQSKEWGEEWAEQAKEWGEEQALIAKGYAEDAEESADKAEQASANAGYMFFHIDENGDLIYQRTSNTQVDFYLQDGDLYVRANA